MKICENCGTISEFTDNQCKACNKSKIVDLKISTQDWFKLTSVQKESVIKKALSLSEETYELIQEAWRNNKKNVQPMSRPMKTNLQQNKPKCPTCGSTNIEKISTTSKAIGFVAVGVFSSNFGKTMHCKNCGYKW